MKPRHFNDRQGRDNPCSAEISRAALAGVWPVLVCAFALLVAAVVIVKALG